jgi:DNA-binding NarL/FixJ family response regulator
MCAVATAPSVDPPARGEPALYHPPPRVLLADDCEEVGQTVASILKLEFEVVGLAKNGQEVLEQVYKCSPDVLVLDLFMPLLSGLEAAKHVNASALPIAVVILTVQEDPDFLEAAIAVGVLGYILKPYINSDLIPAIRSVLKGKLYVSPMFDVR